MVGEHLASLQYHRLSFEAALNLEQSEQVVLSYLGVGFYLGLWYAVQCSSMLAVWKEVQAGTSELMSEAAQGRTRGERESASSFPLFNASFIHLQDMDIPTLFQPHFKNRHTLHSLLM